MGFIEDLEPDRVVVAGDWHGFLLQAKNVIDYAELHDIKVIIVLGDFGFWDRDRSGQRFLKGLNKLLEEAGLVVLFVDGNHEDFPSLYEYPLAEDGSRQVRQHIWHLPRGFRWEWYGVKFAALGGAYSVDRKYRTLNFSYFDEELVTDEELAAFIEGGPADVVFMHDSPAGAPNRVVDDPVSQVNAARTWGAAALDAAAEHRARLATAIDPVDPFLIMHGHYHMPMRGTYTRPGGRECRVVGLDEGGAPLHHHIDVLDVLDLQLQALQDPEKAVDS